MTLPKGWVTTALGDVGELLRGVSYTKKDASSIPLKTHMAILRANNISNGLLNFDELVYVPTQIIQQHQYIKRGDIIICMSSGSKALVGKSAIAKSDCLIAFGAFCGLYRINKMLNSSYIAYAMSTLEYRHHIERLTKGTNINNLKRDHIYSFRFPLPPLPEQHRIVAKIDTLFSELDKGVEVLQAVRQQLRTYRQAVLKWAFERQAWELVQMLNVTSFVTSGSRGWAQYYSNKGAKFIRIGNLTREGIKLMLDDVQSVSLPEGTEGLRSLLKPNDMLISITADLGSIGIVPENLGEAYINQHIALTRFNNPKLVVFYAWYLKSHTGRQRLLKNQRGGGKLGLGLDDIRETLVPSVSEDVATRIVTEIESRLSVCDKLEQLVDENLVKAQALRQSILKKAFAGKLVPQDPNDEPAEKLLERIKAVKADTAKIAGARRKRK